MFLVTEVIVVDDGRNAATDLIPMDERIRSVHSDQRGAKRNPVCEHAGGSTIAHWNDAIRARTMASTLSS